MSSPYIFPVALKKFLPTLHGLQFPCIVPGRTGEGQDPLGIAVQNCCNRLTRLLGLTGQGSDFPPGNGPPSLFNVQRCQLGALLHVELPSTLLQKLRARRGRQEVASSGQVTRTPAMCAGLLRKSPSPVRVPSGNWVYTRIDRCEAEVQTPVGVTAARGPSIISPSCCLF